MPRVYLWASTLEYLMTSPILKIFNHYLLARLEILMTAAFVKSHANLADHDGWAECVNYRMSVSVMGLRLCSRFILRWRMALGCHIANGYYDKQI